MEATEQQAGQAPLNHNRAYLTLTNVSPMTRLPLMTSAGAMSALHTAEIHGRFYGTGRQGQKVTVTSNDGVFFQIS
jgi:hypothetical protein